MCMQIFQPRHFTGGDSDGVNNAGRSLQERLHFPQLQPATFSVPLVSIVPLVSPGIMNYHNLSPQVCMRHLVFNLKLTYPPPHPKKGNNLSVLALQVVVVGVLGHATVQEGPCQVVHSILFVLNRLRHNLGTEVVMQAVVQMALKTHTYTHTHTHTRTNQYTYNHKSDPGRRKVEVI